MPASKWRRLRKQGRVMSDEITVHQDTTFNASRFTVVASVGTLATILGVGIAWGAMNARLNRVEHDVETLAPAAEVQAGFRAIDARLSRIEQGLDRVLMVVPPSAQGPR